MSAMKASEVHGSIMRLEVKKAPQNAPTFRSSAQLTIASFTLIVCVVIAIFVSADHNRPWKSFVDDLDHDGSPDIASHVNVEQCVQHIRDLNVDGTCGLQCNLLGQCVTTVRVTTTSMPTFHHGS
jgi:hypothetical protein